MKIGKGTIYNIEEIESLYPISLPMSIHVQKVSLNLFYVYLVNLLHPRYDKQLANGFLKIRFVYSD